MDKHYTMGKICGVCGKPRTNESTALCQDCNRSQAKSRGGHLHNYPTRRARIGTVAVEGACTHHTVYDDANGPVSKGRCIKCGQPAEAFNSVDSGNGFMRKDKEEVK